MLVKICDSKTFSTVFSYYVSSCNCSVLVSGCLTSFHLRIEFDCSPGAIAQSLALREPKYQETAAYCHFGREPVTKKLSLHLRPPLDSKQTKRPKLFLWRPPCFFLTPTLFSWPFTLFFLGALVFWPPNLVFLLVPTCFFEPWPCFCHPWPCYFDHLLFWPLHLLSSPLVLWSWPLSCGFPMIGRTAATTTAITTILTTYCI